MCEICHFAKCPTGCPNAAEPDAIYTCKECDEGIFDGETYVELNGAYYHEECFEDNAINILYDRDIITIGTAENGHEL